MKKNSMTPSVWLYPFDNVDNQVAIDAAAGTRAVLPVASFKELAFRTGIALLTRELPDAVVIGNPENTVSPENDSYYDNPSDVENLNQTLQAVGVPVVKPGIFLKQRIKHAVKNTPLPVYERTRPRGTEPEDRVPVPYRNHVRVVLPTFNGASSLEHAVRGIIDGWRDHRDALTMHIDIRDDGSTDETAAVARRLVQVMPEYADPDPFGLGLRNRMSLSTVSNVENKGLVATLKEAYGEAIAENANILLDTVQQYEGGKIVPIPLHQLPKTYVIKTDADGDFDTANIMERLLPYARPDANENVDLITSPTKIGDVIAGVRWREILEHENPYEHWRRSDIVATLEREMGLKDLDPPSCGTQFYETGALVKLMGDERIASYDQRWGLDFRMPLVARSLGLKTGVVAFENGKYDPARRPADKVQAQYDTYTETIASMVGKRPEEISTTYKKTPADMR